MASPRGFSECKCTCHSWSSKSILKGLLWSCVKSSTSAMVPGIIVLCVDIFRFFPRFTAKLGLFSSTWSTTSRFFWVGLESGDSSSEFPELSPLANLSDESRKKNTFSAVGFGQDRIPFLSTQHSAVTEPSTWTIFALRPSNMLWPCQRSSQFLSTDLKGSG